MINATARPHGAKLFIEGIEVPFLGATMTHTVNEASIAYIDCVPHYHLNNIKPRSHVLIAIRDYRDSVASINKDEDGNIATGKDEGGSAYPYVVAWEGEVFGISYSKTADSRTISLQAIDQSSYWDNALIYYFNAQTTLSSGAEGIIPVGLDAESAKAQGISVVPTVSSTSSFMKSIIDEVQKDEKRIANKTNTFFHGFVEIIKRLSQINEFYKNAEDKFKLSSQYVLNSSGTLDTLLKDSEAIEWFNGIAGQQTGFATLRSVVLDLMSILFHDVVTVPFPAKINGAPGRFAFKPNLFMLSPPMCNVFFPDEYSSFSYNRNFFLEPTRLLYKPEITVPGGSGTVAMPFSYAPESFYRFMFGAGKQDDPRFTLPVGSEKNNDLDAATGYTKHFSETRSVDANNSQKSIDASPSVREQHFMTKEERYKGIWFSREGCVPANNEFRTALSTPIRGEFLKKTATYLFFKKRFQTREMQVTSHLKLGVVPGFPALVLDASIAKQNMLAYVTSTTHRIYATEGGYTTVSFSYARTVTEQQAAQNFSNDPIIPTWFEEAVFGSVADKTISKETNDEIVRSGTEEEIPGGKKVVRGTYQALSKFYANLLGSRGSQAVIDRYKDEATLNGSVIRLLLEYQAQKQKPNADILDWMHSVSDRGYIRLRDYFKFYGASVGEVDLRSDNLTTASGGIFDRSGQADAVESLARRKIIQKYRDALAANRAFRG
jgi:hypothetical protein